MNFSDLVKAALELGVIPAIAIFLIFGLFLQNRRLMADQRRLLEKFAEVVLRAQVLQGQDTSQLPVPGGGEARPPQLPEATRRGLPPQEAPDLLPAETPKRLPIRRPASNAESVARPRIRTGRVESEYIGSALVLHMKGKITIGVGDVAIREAIDQALEAGQRQIVLDLAAVTSMDSSGIGELVSSYTTVSNRGGHLVLSRPPAKVRDILTVTQLINVFEVFESFEEAVESFGAKDS